jgi:hypothetical protein
MFRETMLSFALEKKIQRTAFNFTLQAKQAKTMIMKGAEPGTDVARPFIYPSCMGGRVSGS